MIIVLTIGRHTRHPVAVLKVLISRDVLQLLSGVAGAAEELRVAHGVDLAVVIVARERDVGFDAVTLAYDHGSIGELRSGDRRIWRILHR